MSGHAHGAWLARLRERADAPPLAPREPLRTSDGRCIGSLESALGDRLAGAGLPLARQAQDWLLHEPLDPALQRIAQWLHAQGLSGRWRGELLDVTETAGGQPLGAVERAAVRPLGITTFAVHLVGLAPGGRVWVQQRALDKATDPGLLDTLMGGLRAAGESVRETLQRETWEEAGLRLDQLEDLRAAGRVSIRRPVREGYMVEHIDVFHAVLGAGAQPENRDGEVARFDCLDPQQLRERLLADAFTLEAALVLAPLLGED